MASTCPACKLPIDPSCISYKGKKYHPQCLEALKAAARAKDAKLAAKASDPERKALEEFLLNIFGLSALPVAVVKQIDQYSKQYTYGDILYALHFYYVLEGNDPASDATIGILPYIYPRAMEHRKRIEAAAKANASFEARSLEATIQIHRPRDGYRALNYTIDEL